MKKFLSLQIFILITFLFSSSNAKQGIVAVINDDLLTDNDVSIRAELIINSSGMAKDRKTLEVVKNHALFTLIDEKLIEDEAKKLDIAIDDKDLNFALQSIADKNGIKLHQLESHMKKININKSELEKQIYHQLLWNKIVHKIIEPKVYLSEREIKEHKNAILKFFEEQKTREAKELDISEIVLYFSEEDHKTREIEKIAEKIYSELNNGKSFASLAKQFSQSASAENSGKIGWIYTSQIRPEITNVIKNLKNGQVARPIILEDGIRIIKLNNRRGFEKLKENEISDNNIRQMIRNKKLDIQMQAYLRKIRREGYINIK